MITTVDLQTYLNDRQEVFEFSIRTLFPLDDEIMDNIEKALLKYRPKYISAPKKTMFHTKPLGFIGVKAAEVFIVELELTVPATKEVIQRDLRENLGMRFNNDQLIVLDGNEPTNDVSEVDEDATPDSVWSAEEHTTDGPLLYTQETEHADFDDYYGDTYNERFLSRLKKEEEKRRSDRKQGEYQPQHHYPEVKGE